MRNFFLTLSLFFIFTSCSQKLPTISVFLYNESDPFIKEFSEFISREAKGKFNPIFYDASNSQTIQNEQINKALSSKNLAMVINPVDRLSSYAIINKLKSENIPAIFFNREPLKHDLDLWDQVWYVGAKPEESGQLQVQVIANLFGGDPHNLNFLDKNQDGIIQTIILKGEQGHQDAEIRTNEVLRRFEQLHWKIQVLKIESANWSHDESYSKIESLLKIYGDSVELIISNNDDMALGAITRMRQLGYFKDTNNDGKIDMFDPSWIPVVGIDGLKEAKDSIEAGYLYGTVRNDSEEMSKTIIDLCQAIYKTIPFDQIATPITNEKYLWVTYKPFIAQ